MKIRAVYKYKLYSDILRLCYKDTLVEDLSVKDLSKLNEYKLSKLVSFFDDSCYLRLTRGDSYEICNGKFRELDFYYGDIYNHVGCSYVDPSGSTKKENLFRLPQETPILKDWLPRSIDHVTAQYWVNDTVEDLKLIDSDKGEILWCFKVPEVERLHDYDLPTNVRKVLGIYKNNLWIQLPDDRILGLDMQTGKMNHEFRNPYFASIPQGIFLDKRGVIITFHFNYYAEFDLDKFVFSKDRIISDKEKLLITYVTHRDDDKYLYFIGSKDNCYEDNVYGIFDTESMEFVFLKERDPDGGFFNLAPQVNDDLFAILDYRGNLIIHRKDEMLAGSGSSL